MLDLVFLLPFQSPLLLVINEGDPIFLNLLEVLSFLFFGIDICVHFPS